MNRKAVSRIQAIVIIAVILSLLLSALLVNLRNPSPKSPVENVKHGNLKKSIIEARAEGEILHYQNQSFWSEQSFVEILESKDKFRLEQISSLNTSLQKHGEVMLNAMVEFSEENRSTTLFCDIKGIMYSTNSYDFH